MCCDWQPVLLVVILKKSLEKLLGSDVQRFCQPDELWQKKRTNRETGRSLLEDNPVWYAEDQKSWFANFCIAFKRPWNDTMDCKQQTDRQRDRDPGRWMCWMQMKHSMTRPAWEMYGKTAKQYNNWNFKGYFTSCTTSLIMQHHIWVILHCCMYFWMMTDATLDCNNTCCCILRVK